MTRLSDLLRRAMIAVTLIGAVLLGGCASFSPDGGVGVAAHVVHDAYGHEPASLDSPEAVLAAQSRVAQLLKKPLTPSSAVEIALLSNRGLQAAFNRLGVADAVRARQSLPPNPTISISRVAGSLSSEIEGAIAADILALATLPARAEIAQERFEAAQLEAAETTLRVAAEARRSYYRAVGLREQVAALEQAAKAAETTAKFARSLGETGAMNRLDQARDQVFYAEVTARLAGTRQQALAERERLIRALGLWGANTSITLPSALPAPPAQPRELPLVERDAVDHRVELQLARKQLDVLTKSLGLTQSTRFISLFELSSQGKIKREDVEGEHVRFDMAGLGASIEIPIFDLGATRLREAEQRWLEAVNRLLEKAVNVRSEAREAYRNYRAAHEISRHHMREILPLYTIINEETLRRYNTMLIDVFPLIEAARRRMIAIAAAIDAKRDFWLAEIDLRGAVVGGGFRSGDRAAATAAADMGDQQ